MSKQEIAKMLIGSRPKSNYQLHWGYAKNIELTEDDLSRARQSHESIKDTSAGQIAVKRVLRAEDSSQKARAHYDSNLREARHHYETYAGPYTEQAIAEAETDGKGIHLAPNPATPKE